MNGDKPVGPTYLLHQNACSLTRNHWQTCLKALADTLGETALFTTPGAMQLAAPVVNMRGANGSPTCGMRSPA
jgi:hypothetical protein